VSCILISKGHFVMNTRVERLGSSATLFDRLGYNILNILGHILVVDFTGFLIAKSSSSLDIRRLVTLPIVG
jgi:hypothetical protein